MTSKEWFARADLVDSFAQLLREDIVQAALSVVENAGRPRAVLRPDSPSLMENNALLNARREGYFEALSNLQSLGAPRVKSEREFVPWQHAGHETE